MIIVNRCSFKGDIIEWCFQRGRKWRIHPIQAVLYKQKNYLLESLKTYEKISHITCLRSSPSTQQFIALQKIIIIHNILKLAYQLTQT